MSKFVSVSGECKWSISLKQLLQAFSSFVNHTSVNTSSVLWLVVSFLSSTLFWHVYRFLGAQFKMCHLTSFFWRAWTVWNGCIRQQQLPAHIYLCRPRLHKANLELGPYKKNMYAYQIQNVKIILSKLSFCKILDFTERLYKKVFD